MNSSEWLYRQLLEHAHYSISSRRPGVFTTLNPLLSICFHRILTASIRFWDWKFMLPFMLNLNFMLFISLGLLGEVKPTSKLTSLSTVLNLSKIFIFSYGCHPKLLPTSSLWPSLCSRSRLFCFVLFCSVLFCSVLFCTVLFCSVLFCSSVLFCFVFVFVFLQFSAHFQ